MYVTTDAGAPGADCTGTSGFDDIKAGAQVVITGPAGETVGVGQLEPGSTANDPDLSGRYTHCRFLFTVTGVPAGKRFYGIAVGHRDPLQETEADLKRPLQLTLG